MQKTFFVFLNLLVDALHFLFVEHFINFFKFFFHQTGNVFNFCNEAVKLNGSLALRSQAATVYRDGTILTAVTAAATGQHTVAFLGTNYGSVKKVSAGQKSSF